jgi:hypothetical protein
MIDKGEFADVDAIFGGAELMAEAYEWEDDYERAAYAWASPSADGELSGAECLAQDILQRLFDLVEGTEKSMYSPEQLKMLEDFVDRFNAKTP